MPIYLYFFYPFPDCPSYTSLQNFSGNTPAYISLKRPSLAAVLVEIEVEVEEPAQETLARAVNWVNERGYQAKNQQNDSSTLEDLGPLTWQRLNHAVALLCTTSHAQGAYVDTTLIWCSWNRCRCLRRAGLADGKCPFGVVEVLDALGNGTDGGSGGRHL